MTTLQLTITFPQISFWILLLPLAPFVVPQALIESLIVLPNQFGNCDPIDEIILETGSGGDPGLVASNLLAISSQYDPSDSRYSNTLLNILVLSFQIICESRSPIENKVATTTVHVTYICLGFDCPLVTITPKGYFSFFCDPDTNRFMNQGEVLNEFSSQYYGSLTFSPTPETYGSCRLCAIDDPYIYNSPTIGSSRYDSATGCVGKYIIACIYRQGSWRFPPIAYYCSCSLDVCVACKGGVGFK